MVRPITPLNSIADRKARRHLLTGLGLSFAGAAVATSGHAESATKVSSSKTRHRIVFQVDSADEKIIGHAISGTMNLSRLYNDAKQAFEIEIVANASGIQMLRADTSTVVEPLATLRGLIPTLTLSVCGSSATIASQKEGHELVFLSGVKVVPYGVGRLVELQEAGWSYIHA
jgi:intracellular sulfur oxidation DsrE/DsrF family protein